jgi:sugar lactone lactonase YvrE
MREGSPAAPGRLGSRTALPRRTFLQHGGLLALALLSGGMAWKCSSRAPSAAALLGPDANGLLLPAGVTSRVVARSGRRPAPGSPYLWHDAPDGGATFPTPDGGWVYVSNSERSGGQGGAGALRFAPDGTVVDAYAILSGTERNCAGGPTPWGTWLSCEEVPVGRVWECDPLGHRPAAVRPALGVFSHEAVAVDPVRRRLYLTEDEPDGRLYRFTPAGYPDLSAGTLEAARVVSGMTGAIAWEPVPDPAAAGTPTRRQVPAGTAFDGGEGIWYHKDAVVFTSKGDGRVWRLELEGAATDTLSVLYHAAAAPDPVLTGVDTVIVDSDGAVLVAEDGGDMQVVALLPIGGAYPIVQVLGHPESEITGLAFSPDGTRFYFSSQRGATGLGSGGITYELRGEEAG